MIRQNAQTLRGALTVRGFCGMIDQKGGQKMDEKGKQAPKTSKAQLDAIRRWRPKRDSLSIAFAIMAGHIERWQAAAASAGQTLTKGVITALDAAAASQGVTAETVTDHASATATAADAAEIGSGE